MKITANGTDAIDFVANVEKVLLGVAARYAPERIVLIQIDNWFGPRWLGFSGKSIGALGLWKNTLTVPPFVPNRVISERAFLAPSYDEVEQPHRIHRRMASTFALGRNVADVVPKAALVWYSGNSNDAGRGSLMVYAPKGTLIIPGMPSGKTTNHGMWLKLRYSSS